MNRENKMGYKPMGKLLIEMSLPIMLSMFIQALYNIVDSRFVSQINENAFTAVSIALPIQNLMIGVGVGAGVGVNALLSRSLGEKNNRQANLAAENGFFLCIIHSIVFVLFGLFLSRIYYSMQTTNIEVINYGSEYISICTIFSIGIFTQIMTERILQSTGRTIIAMISQTIGAVINIILDPIFIFGLFNVPALGVKGAAIATVLGQVLGAIIAFTLNYKYNADVEIKRIFPDINTIRKIYIIGVPSMILIAIGSVAIYLLNGILDRFSTTAVAALGAYFKVQSFIFMPIFGLTNGMVPVLAYNYGAGNSERAKKVVDLSLKSGILFMTFGFLIFQIFPKQLLGIFNASDKLIEIGIPMLRIISTAFMMAGYNIVSGSTFQALGNGMLSLMSSVVRQLLVLLPVAYIFAAMGNLTLVWCSYPIAEIADFLFCKYYLKNFAINKIESLNY
ncbi:MATE family efflux transporter [Peptoniphilus mikwangii]|uniref:MATE family efflux transporter n=1 Tax=Peptoniphilus mikwangii TaxID=1354300 RepID=UPI00041F2671|nr:MATE family efflux transporter [Peptoniphilus mikwangii]